MMKVGSLFSGIFGLDLGVGGDVRWACDVSTVSRMVKDRSFPEARWFDDVRAIHGPPGVDLITGGFPCQDISMAGRGAGIHGKKSSLWKHMARVIGNAEPGEVFIENVEALTRRGLGVVLHDLSKLGYDAIWGVFSSAGVGAPHLRKRLFIYAGKEASHSYRQATGVPGGRDTAEPGSGVGTDEKFGRYTEPIAHWARKFGPPPPLVTWTRGLPRPNAAFVEWMMGFPEGWVTDLEVSNSAHWAALGNAVQPQTAELAYHHLKENFHADRA